MCRISVAAWIRACRGIHIAELIWTLLSMYIFDITHSIWTEPDRLAQACSDRKPEGWCHAKGHSPHWLASDAKGVMRRDGGVTTTLREHC